MNPTPDKQKNKLNEEKSAHSNPCTDLFFKAFKALFYWASVLQDKSIEWTQQHTKFEDDHMICRDATLSRTCLSNKKKNMKPQRCFVNITCQALF